MFKNLILNKVNNEKNNNELNKHNRENIDNAISSSRNIEFDIARGLGILYVIMGHADFPLLMFISLFHMPLFFIISVFFLKKNIAQT